MNNLLRKYRYYLPSTNLFWVVKTFCSKRVFEYAKRKSFLLLGFRPIYQNYDQLDYLVEINRIWDPSIDDYKHDSVELLKRVYTINPEWVHVFVNEIIQASLSYCTGPSHEDCMKCLDWLEEMNITDEYGDRHRIFRMSTIHLQQFP